MIRIAISGATGRMGKMLLEAVAASEDMELVAALTQSGASELGSNPLATYGKNTSVRISDDPAVLANADVLIDFTRPEATLNYLPVCVENNVAVVIGTTGFDTHGHELIAAASEKIPVVLAPNMSVGVNAAIKLIKPPPNCWHSTIVKSLRCTTSIRLTHHPEQHCKWGVL